MTNSEVAGQRRPVWIVLQFASFFFLYWIGFGLVISDGILYAQLIMDPCAQTGVAVRNGTGAEGLSVLDVSQYSYRMNGSNAAVTTTLNNSNSSDVCSAGGSASCGGFGKGAARTAWISSIEGGVRTLTVFLSALAFDTFGVQVSVMVGCLMSSLGLLLSTFATQLYHVYLGRGVLTGMGNGILFAAPVTCFARTHGEKMTFGVGFAYIGCGFGAVVFGYVGKEIIAIGGWQWYYRFIGFIALALMPTSCLVLPKSLDRGSNAHRPLGGSDSGSSPHNAVQRFQAGLAELGNSLKKGAVLFRDVNFLLVWIAFIPFSVGYFFPVVASSHRSIVLGINICSAYLQAAYIGFGTIGGALIFLAASYFQVRAIFMQSVGLICMGISTLLSILVTTEAGLTVYTIIYAVLLSIVSCAGGPGMREVVSADMVSHSYGHLFLISAPFTVIGAPISGWIYDATQSYTLPLVFGGVLLIIAGVLSLIVDIRLWIRQPQNRHEKQSAAEADETSEPSVLESCAKWDASRQAKARCMVVSSV